MASPGPNSPMMKAAVVGAGEMGSHHIRVLNEIAGVRLVGVADAEAPALERSLLGRTASGYATAKEMFATEGPDLVVVAVPTLEHESVATMALEAGAHVLIEKPVAPDSASAFRLRDLAEREHRIATVGHIERFNPAIIELRHRVRSGEIGKIFQVVARRTGPFPTRVRDIGVVKDLATHDLDVIGFVFDSPFASIAAQVSRHLHAGQEDLASVLARLEDGTIVVLEVNWLTPTKVREFRVIGEGGMFIADYIRQDLTLYRNREHVSEYGELNTFTGVSEGEVVRFPIDRKEPLRAELEAFVDAAVSGGPPPVPIDSAVRAIDLAERILQASDGDGTQATGPN